MLTRGGFAKQACSEGPVSRLSVRCGFILQRPKPQAMNRTSSASEAGALAAVGRKDEVNYQLLP